MRNSRRCIVTGGCGFIGSALVRHLCREGREVLVVDKLTYAGNVESLKEVEGKYTLLVKDICDQEAMDSAFAEFRPDTIFHLAAESHVDRSIDGPGEFVRTNVVGTATLLQSALKYWKTLPDRDAFVFQHISTDEVYGTLGETGFFTERTPYSPHSPYSASKASSDHLVRAWHDTYGMPVLITNCSNNYGPYHFPEKLIPLVILNCLDGRIREGRERARLALRRRPREGALPREREGRSGGDVQRRRTQRAHEHRGREDRLRDPRRAEAARRNGRGLWRPRTPPEV